MNTKNIVIGLLAAALLFLAVKSYASRGPVPVATGPADLDTPDNRQKCTKEHKEALGIQETQDQAPLVGIINMRCPHTGAVYPFGSAGHITSSSPASASYVSRAAIKYLESKGWKRV